MTREFFEGLNPQLKQEVERKMNQQKENLDKANQEIKKNCPDVKIGKAIVLYFNFETGETYGKTVHPGE